MWQATTQQRGRREGGPRITSRSLPKNNESRTWQRVTDMATSHGHGRKNQGSVLVAQLRSNSIKQILDIAWSMSIGMKRWGPVVDL